MTTTAVEPRVLEKIQKCLAMARDGRGDPTEAATALRMAQSLMSKHGVDELGLAASTIDKDYLKSPFSVSRMKDFELSLMQGIAAAFGCEVLWRKNQSSNTDDYYGRWTFVGPKAYLEICVYTATVLQRQLVKARAQFVRGCTARNKTPAADGFCHGWTATVLKTVAAFADPDGSLAAARAAFKERFMSISGKTVDAQARRGTFDGFLAGKEAAAGVSLRRPMNGERSGSKLLLGA